jgi:hypothetical protein
VIGREDALETTASLGFLILSSLARRARSGRERRRVCDDASVSTKRRSRRAAAAPPVLTIYAFLYYASRIVLKKRAFVHFASRAVDVAHSAPRVYVTAFFKLIQA